MDKKTFWTCTAVGFVITQILVRYLDKKRQEKQARDELEVMRTVDSWFKDVLDQEANKSAEDLTR